VSLNTIVKRYIGAYIRTCTKIRIKSGYPDLAWIKINWKSGFAKVDGYCKPYQWPWMTLNGVMAVTLRYFTEFGKPALQKTMCARPPGIPVREFPGIPGNFWNSGGNCREFIGVLSFFPIFIVDSDILLFNLTHCIMCTTHDRPRLTLTAFWAKPWMTSLTQLIVFIEYRDIFKYWYRQITEQRQNFAYWDRYTNEDATLR